MDLGSWCDGFGLQREDEKGKDGVGEVSGNASHLPLASAAFGRTLGDTGWERACWKKEERGDEVGCSEAVAARTLLLRKKGETIKASPTRLSEKV
jgi:hypothetical protein